MPWKLPPRPQTSETQTILQETTHCDSSQKDFLEEVILN